MTTDKPKRFFPYLGEERIKWLKEEANRLHVNDSDLLRRIIDEYRQRKEVEK